MFRGSVIRAAPGVPGKVTMALTFLHRVSRPYLFASKRPTYLSHPLSNPHRSGPSYTSRPWPLPTAMLLQLRRLPSSTS